MNINSPKIKKKIEDSLDKFRLPGLRKFLVDFVGKSKWSELHENKMNQFFKESKDIFFSYLSEVEFDGFAINVGKLGIYSSYMDFCTLFRVGSIYQVCICIDEGLFNSGSINDFKIEGASVNYCFDAVINTTRIPYKNNSEYIFHFDSQNCNPVSFGVDKDDLFSLECVKEFINKIIYP